MTQPYNALYGPPQAPVDNALYYDDTQGMPRQRPADPLRWAADYIGQNKDLPAPQFFMDPRALSLRNMLHAGLNTSANWLDGTKDPSLVGPDEVISPLGLGLGVSAASAAKNALSRPGRDFRIADDLARQHPGASPVGDIPRFAPLRDASNPTSAAHVADYGSVPGARPPMNSNATPYAVMADNAKGSAPGTVVNSIAEQPQTIRAYHGTDAKFDRFDPSFTDEVGYHFGTKQQAADRMRNKDRSDSGLPWPFTSWRRIPVDIEAKRILDIADDPGSFNGQTLAIRLHQEGKMPSDVLDEVYRRSGKDLDDATAYVRDWIKDQGYDLVRYPNKLEGGGEHSFMALGTGNVRHARTGKVMFSDSASAPGLAANSTQQDDQGVMSILRRYGLAD